LIAAASYFVDTVNGIVKLIDGLRFSSGFGNVKIVYTGGYKVIPKDLELACSQMVYADYLEVKGGANVIEGETITYKPANLRKQAYLKLDQFKRMLIA
jgi:hypothetical protein